MFIETGIKKMIKEKIMGKDCSDLTYIQELIKEVKLIEKIHLIAENQLMILLGVVNGIGDELAKKEFVNKNDFCRIAKDKIEEYSKLVEEKEEILNKIKVNREKRYNVE